MTINTNANAMMNYSQQVDRTSNNIANVNTDGFVPSSQSDNGSERSQVNLAKEIPDLVVEQSAFEVQAPAIKTQDEMIGTLLDIVT